MPSARRHSGAGPSSPQYSSRRTIFPCRNVKNDAAWKEVPSGPYTRTAVAAASASAWTRSISIRQFPGYSRLARTNSSAVKHSSVLCQKISAPGRKYAASASHRCAPISAHNACANAAEAIFPFLSERTSFLELYFLVKKRPKYDTNCNIII